jgi:hypothetical protein
MPGQHTHQQDEGAALPFHHRVVPSPLVVAAEVLAPRLLLLQLILHLSPGGRAGWQAQARVESSAQQAVRTIMLHHPVRCGALGLARWGKASHTQPLPPPAVPSCCTHLNAWAVSQGTPLSMLSSTWCTCPPEAASQ